MLSLGDTLEITVALLRRSVELQVATMPATVAWLARSPSLAA